MTSSILKKKRFEDGNKTFTVSRFVNRAYVFENKLFFTAKCFASLIVFNIGVCIDDFHQKIFRKLIQDQFNEWLKATTILIRNIW